LDRAKISYRLPVPGARIRNGQMEANVPIAGLKIQYRAGNGPWRVYRNPVPVPLSGRSPVSLRTLSPDGHRVSRTVTVY
jgi:hexosaminidase